MSRWILRWTPSLELAVGLLCAVNVAIAQPSFTPNIYWPGLSQDDINRMEAAAARLYEGRSIGTIERWRSPDSKNAGEVKLIRGFDTNNMPCRTIDYTIRFEERRNLPNHYVVNWCKTPDGTWKIVELPIHR